MYTYTVKKSDWLETGLYRAFSGLSWVHMKTKGLFSSIQPCSLTLAGTLNTVLAGFAGGLCGDTQIGSNFVSANYSANQIIDQF